LNLNHRIAEIKLGAVANNKPTAIGMEAIAIAVAMAVEIMVGIAVAS
jgi:hypothetical protein